METVVSLAELVSLHLRGFIPASEVARQTVSITIELIETWVR